MLGRLSWQKDNKGGDFRLSLLTPLGQMSQILSQNILQDLSKQNSKNSHVKTAFPRIVCLTVMVASCPMYLTPLHWYGVCVYVWKYSMTVMWQWGALPIRSPFVSQPRKTTVV